jgi:predicted secreted protein
MLYRGVVRLAVPLLAARALAVVSVASMGCHHDGAPPHPSGPPDTRTPADAPAAAVEDADAAYAVVHAEDDGRTFDLPPGGALVFRLASRSGTGFVWRPVPLDGGVLTPVGERTSEVSSEVPGAPRLDVYRFVARSVGTTGIEMDYGRPWGNQAPVRTVRVTVNVH